MSAFDGAILKRADAVCEAAISDVAGLLGKQDAIVVKAPAGAGKSYFVGTALGALRQRGARVAVCAPTNEQVYGLVERFARRYPRETIVFVPATGRTLPTSASLANVRSLTAAESREWPIIVGTLHKLGYDPDALGSYDALLMDEAYQANAGQYYGVGDIAPTHLLVGDSGQLDPFSTMDNADRWRGLEEDPLQTAVGVLLRNHPETTVHHLPVSRRLDPRAVELVRGFYPGHDFGAAILPGVRQFRLAPGRNGGGGSVIDETLDTAASSGWCHLELPDAAVMTADPLTIETITSLVARLAERTPEVCGEYTDGFKPLEPNDIAVAVSHNDQKDYLRAALDAAGHRSVVVDTANKLQGLQFEVVIAWHPLAGLPDVDGFHLDPGRLCVMLTRHRQACIVIGRASDRVLVAGLPPSTPAYLGWDPDPVLDGWAVHQNVFTSLDAYRVEFQASPVRATARADTTATSQAEAAGRQEPALAVPPRETSRPETRRLCRECQRPIRFEALDGGRWRPVDLDGKQHRCAAGQSMKDAPPRVSARTLAIAIPSVSIGQEEGWSSCPAPSNGRPTRKTRSESEVLEEVLAEIDRRMRDVGPVDVGPEAPSQPKPRLPLGNRARTETPRTRRARLGSRGPGETVSQSAEQIPEDYSRYLEEKVGQRPSPTAASLRTVAPQTSASRPPVLQPRAKEPSRDRRPYTLPPRTEHIPGGRPAHSPRLASPPSPERLTAPVSSRAGSICNKCGRQWVSPSVDLAQPHFARDDAHLEELARERGGMWEAALCLPERGQLIRIRDIEGSPPGHVHSPACGAQTTKTTHRVKATGN